MPILPPPPGYLDPFCEEEYLEEPTPTTNDEDWVVSLKERDILKLLHTDWAYSRDNIGVMNGLIDNKIIPRMRRLEFESDVSLLIEGMTAAGIIREKTIRGITRLILKG